MDGIELYRYRKENGLCVKCGILLDSLGVRCIKCQKHKNAKDMLERRKVRNIVFLVYGNACACCGETMDKFLAIDHMDNNGAAHRRELGSKGRNLYRWLKQHNYPSNFQILCHNCNSGRHLNGGVCPHKTSERLMLHKLSNIPMLY